jgi:hypothetical protein
MTWRIVVLVAAGCGRVGFDPRGGASLDATGDGVTDGVTIDAPPCGPMVVMSDNFDAGTIDNSKWNQIVNAGLTVTETAGDLQMTLISANGFNYVTFPAVTAYPLGTCTARITIVEAPRAVAGAECAFCLTNAGTTPSQLCFDISGGIIASYFKMGTVTDYITQTFDPVAHSHLRFRQDATNVIWETSSDGATWNLFDARPPPIDMSQIHVEMFAGTFMNVANPGQARYDDLIIE